MDDLLKRLAGMGAYIESRQQEDFDLGTFAALNRMPPKDAARAITALAALILEAAGCASEETANMQTDSSAVWLSRLLSVCLTDGPLRLIGFRLSDILMDTVQYPTLREGSNNPIIRAISQQKPTEEELNDVDLVTTRMANILGVHPDELTIISKEQDDRTKKPFLN